MATEKIEVDIDNIYIIKGNSIVIKTTYTGGENNIVKPTSKIGYQPNQNYPGVSVTDYEGDNRKNNPDTDNKIIINWFEIKTTDNRDLSKIELTFKAVDVDNSTITKSASYAQIQHQDIDKSSVRLQIENNGFLVALNPPETFPNESDKHLLLSLSIKKNDNSPLPCQLCLVPINDNASSKFWIIDNGEELFTYVLKDTDGYDKPGYRVNTDSNGNINLNIFPKSDNNNTSMYIHPVINPESEFYTDVTILIITDIISPSNGIPSPSCDQVIDGQLTPPAIGYNPIFYVETPNYKGRKENDTIFLINNNSDGNIILDKYAFDVTNPKNNIRGIPYAAISETGNNDIYYYVSDYMGTTVRSQPLYYYLKEKHNNFPPAGGIFDSPTIYDANGNRVYSRVTVDIYKNGGLRCHIPVGMTNQLQKDESYEVYLIINGYDAATGHPKSINKPLGVKQITLNDLENHYAVFPILPTNLEDIDSDEAGEPGQIFIYYTNGQTNQEPSNFSKYWQGKIRTISPGDDS